MKGISKPHLSHIRSQYDIYLWSEVGYGFRAAGCQKLFRLLANYMKVMRNDARVSEPGAVQRAVLRIDPATNKNHAHAHLGSG